MKTKLLILLFVISCILTGCTRCTGEIDINSIEDGIAKVIDGNTIELNNGLKVHINGLKDNTFTKEYLEHYVGENVTLTSDSQAISSTASSYDDEIEAYVAVVRTGEDLGYELLKLAGERAYYPHTCHDRKAEYEALFEKHSQILSSDQLCAKMTASSMLVSAGNYDGKWIGTAFFIGNDGLALTNNHVLNHQADAVVYISNTEGNIDRQQPYKIKRIVQTNEEFDYTIFYVDLDPTTLKRIVYLPLAKDQKCFARGAEIASIGNPAPGGEILTMSFATGTISALRPEQGKIQQDVAITHGFSGGPTANFYGEVVGISQSGYENNNANLNFAVDIRLVRQTLDDLNIPYAGK